MLGNLIGKLLAGPEATPSEELVEFLLFSLCGAERHLAVTEELVRSEVWSERSNGWAFVPTQPLSKESIRVGLKELRARGYLRRLPGKRWSLTSSGITACKQARSRCIAYQQQHDAQRAQDAANAKAQAERAAKEAFLRAEAAEAAEQAVEPTKPSKRSRLSPLAERLG